MIELYSVKDVAKLFGQRESRLRYWISSGFLWPSIRRRGQYFYTFEDLITIKAAVELLNSGLSVQKVRNALTELRNELPDGVAPTSRLRICSDGNGVVVIKDEVAYEPKTKQLVMAFEVSSLSSQIAEVLPINGKGRQSDVEPDAQAAPALPPSAYQLFLHGCRADDQGAFTKAEQYYRQCLDIENSMAAAHTNLGNLLHKQGLLDEAKHSYDQALLHDPDQAEARFNLGNLLDEMGNTEMAIAELRHVCSRSPEFADAHFNLGLLLAQVGGQAQAAEHLRRYLSLDAASTWATQARTYLEQSS